MKIITDEQIEEITKLAFRNSGLRITGILKNLKEFQEDTLRDELRGFLMNKGKSSIMKREIWDILDNTNTKNQGGNKMEDKSEEEKEKEEQEEEETSKEEESEEAKDTADDTEESTEESSE